MASIITHITVGTSDFNKSKDFYTQALRCLGYIPATEMEGLVGYGVSRDDEASFWISISAPISPDLHYCFTAPTRQSVDAFYAKALELGATDNGKPGLREYRPDYYAAYVIDHDGHRIEALCLS